MGIFSGGELANIIEWQEYRDDVIFWKWANSEIKRGSRLIVRQGQDAIFMYNGKVEGVFSDEGNFEIESQIIPFLSTLKGFKFGFNSGLRAEILFVNTKEFTVKWGTKSAVMLPVESLPGGMPIRAYGIFTCKVVDYLTLIEKIAGVRRQYTVEELRDRVIGQLDPLLMKWIVAEGKNMFNIQMNATEIGEGIRSDLDMELHKIGMSVTSFAIQSVTYPEEVQEMVKKAAGQSMISDVDKYTQIAMADGMEKGGSVAGDIAQLGVGIAMGQQVASQITGQAPAAPAPAPAAPAAPAAPQMQAPGKKKYNFCPNCGKPANEGNFCSNCGFKFE
ncbi:MAG: SPFH domain-containing protein [Lachnospiraceae bacterium]|nr:SPFH domain-containing protein [Lachnospiraceae bacterium]